MNLMKNQSFYEYPLVYDALRTPQDPRAVEKLYDAIVKHLGHPPKSVMDPACGPATWLIFFCNQNIPVAGNDIVPAMVDTAIQKCGNHALEFIVGDMRDLKFKRGPFEVALELNGTCLIFIDEPNFYQFLHGLAQHVMPGGLILLTIFFVEPCPSHYPFLVDQWGPMPVQGGGKAWISYEVLATDTVHNIDKVRRTVRTQDVPGCPNLLVDEYDAFSWTEQGFLNFLKSIPELQVIDSFSIESTDIKRTQWGEQRGETTVVLRKAEKPPLF